MEKEEIEKHMEREEKDEKEQVENDQVEKDQVEKEQVEKEQVENDQVENAQVENAQVENAQVENDQVENNQVENAQVENDQEEKEQDTLEKSEGPEEPNEQLENNKKKWPLWKKSLLIGSSILMLLVLSGLYLIYTNHGNQLLIKVVSDYSYGKFKQVQSVNTPKIDEEGEDLDNINSNDLIIQPVIKEEQKIFNLLLLGVENFEGASNTDTMMIATIDTKNNELKLTSILRDIYVEIPDHNNNKLNAPYSMGGISLLYNTIKLNFGIEVDGYVLVNYDAFERIIDYMDGVEVTLTLREANYLNRTNYISNPAYRTVREGTQWMNGNQALGYSRIRGVSTGKEADDFGRTSRQRVVLESLFNKIKSLNLIDLGLKMNHVINKIEVETDISKEEYTQYLEMAFKLKSAQLKTYRVPENGSYMDETHKIGRLDQLVLVPKNWEETRSKLHQFIYGIQ